MGNSPLISVIIPARNAVATLKQTLDSVLAQSETDWEALIIDDGSTDGTAAIIDAYTARDKRFVSLAGPGIGASGARNVGIFTARGKWLHFLDADDWTEPHFLKKMLAALHSAPEAVVAYCGYRRVFADGRMAPPFESLKVAEDAFEEFARTCTVAIHALLVDRVIIVKLGGFDTQLLSCEDWDMWQRVSRFGGRWVYVDDPMAFYRTGEPSLSQNVEWLITYSSIVIKRGFGVDERLAGMAPVRAAGASPERGSAGEAIAYSTLWVAGMDCGNGGTGKFDPTILQPIIAPVMETVRIAENIFDGIMVGARSLVHEMAGNWPRYGAALTAFITWLGEACGNASAARAVQYHIESKILEYDKSAETRILGLTFGARIDMLNLESTPLPEGADCIYAYLVVGSKLITRLQVAALGIITKQQWLEILTVQPEPNDRIFKLRRRLPANRHVLIHEAKEFARDLRWILRLHRFRKARARLKRHMQTDIELAEPPDSHKLRLQNVIARAAGRAARDESAGPVVVAKPFEESGVDANQRQAHFENLFDVEDPWNYNSAYEQQKYERQIAILPPGPIARALELACAEGHFTVQLAPHVGRLLATDISPKALARTQSRCAGHNNIDYQTLDFSAEPIPGEMDLIICSEVLYYLADEAELRKLAPAIAAALRPGGSLVTAHAYLLRDNMARTGFDWETIYGAEVINRVFSDTPGLVLEQSLDTELYRIDRFRRVEAAAEAVAPVIENAPVVETLDQKVAQYIVWGGASARRAQVANERRRHMPVLMYHGVSETGPDALARYRQTPAMFKAQMRWLRANGYHSIGSAELENYLRERRPFAGRPVLITFDDGFQDFADNAWPILRAHDFTAEMFIVTERVGKAAIWDAQFGSPAPLMIAGTIASLAAEGALFGSHLATHRAINGLSSLELAEELAGSRAMLGKWLGEMPCSFAAPFSITDGRLVRMAIDCGYKICFGGQAGVARLGMNPLDLPRIEVPGGGDLDDFIRLMQAAT